MKTTTRLFFCASASLSPLLALSFRIFSLFLFYLSPTPPHTTTHTNTTHPHKKNTHTIATHTIHPTHTTKRAFFLLNFFSCA